MLLMVRVPFGLELVFVFFVFFLTEPPRLLYLGTVGCFRDPTFLRNYLFGPGAFCISGLTLGLIPFPPFLQECLY